jgi:hypothetical protein
MPESAPQAASMLLCPPDSRFEFTPVPRRFNNKFTVGEATDEPHQWLAKTLAPPKSFCGSDQPIEIFLVARAQGQDQKLRRVVRMSGENQFFQRGQF